MAQTVIITLTAAGLDTGPFDLYSNADGYAAPFQTGVTKSSLLVGYVSNVVPNAATIIRVKSVNELCTNYIDLNIPAVTTTTTSTSTSTTSTTSTSTTSTTSTTTTAFACADCRNWNYVSGNIPAEGDVIHWYSCIDGSPQSRALSFGDPDGNFCNCNSIGNPYSENGTTLTEVGTCENVGEWYQVEDCFTPGTSYYSKEYPTDTFNIGDRVLNGLNVFTVVNVLTSPPLYPNDLELTPALNPITSAQLTGCPDIVLIDLFPFYDDFNEGDRVRAIWSSPAVSGPELGFSGTVKRYQTTGCVNELNTTYFAPGGLNAVAIDNGSYQDQTSCQNLAGASPTVPSNSKLKITALTIYTQATPFARDINGCPTDFSTATVVATPTANNYSGTYRFSIYDPVASDYVYFSIIGCFSCPL